MDCEQVIRDEVAEQYLKGELTGSDRQAFERHYFECERCFDELETCRALRQVLQETAEVPAGVAARSGKWFDWRLAAAAAGVVLAITLGSRLPQTPAAPPPAPPTSLPGSGAGSVEPALPPADVALPELANVVPPNYLPTVLRGVPDDAARLFRRAMEHYAAGDYAAARIGLQAAAARNKDAPDIAFFLGVCFLLTGDTAAAVEQLRLTIALGDSPFLEEARFYLAKAHLRRAEVEAAASELAKTIALRGDRENEARELLQKVDVLRKSRPK